jgi:tetratricopeptide (TPR) repeat protein
VADNPRIEELRRRVQKDPASIAFAQLAEEYRRSGDHEEAVRVCRTGLAKHPSYLSARVTLGRALIELTQYDDARTELDYVLRSAPENLAAIRGLAEIHQRRGELVEALKQYETALGIAQHDPELEDAVEELTRQLGGVPAERPRVKASLPVAVGPARGDGGTEMSVGGLATPPPIPIGDGTVDDGLEAAASAFAASAVALETCATPPDVAPSQLSPELEAAADEFSRALAALDAITIDVPMPSLSAGPFDLPPMPVKAVVAAQPVIPEPLVPVVQHPEPNAEAIADLQNWLDNIVVEKGTPKR